jgi:hypothetical protein
MAFGTSESGCFLPTAECGAPTIMKICEICVNLRNLRSGIPGHGKAMDVLDSAKALAMLQRSRWT